jgi:hypothetical protein
MIRFKFTGLAFAISARLARFNEPDNATPRSRADSIESPMALGDTEKNEIPMSAGLHPASIQAVGWSNVG